MSVFESEPNHAKADKANNAVAISLDNEGQKFTQGRPKTLILQPQQIVAFYVWLPRKGTTTYNRAEV